MSSQHHRSTRDYDSTVGLQEHAERLSRRVTDSAQQVWLAGLGAFGRAQAEGSKFFDSLVREGQSIEEKSRSADGHRPENLRETVEHNLGQVRDRAAGTWDRVEKTFEDRVQRVLRTLQVPSRADIEELNARIDGLTGRLNRAETRVDHVTAAQAKASQDPPNV